MAAEAGRIRFGLITDVHQDFSDRAIDRLKAFIEHMNREQVDFIIQLGDFCFPIEENREFLSVWESFQGPKYHVLGNHDMDSCDKKTIMDYLGMERNYYSFDCGDYHFVVLDGNYLQTEDGLVDYAHGNYHPYSVRFRNHITDEQLQWLKEDLAATEKTTIIFSHQSLENSYVGVKSSEAIHQLLRETNEAAGRRKVIACMNGHNHLDGVKVIEDVYFIHVNSSSYFWMGRGAEADPAPYSEEIMAKYPFMKHSVPYRDPLYALVTLEPGWMTIEGRESEFVGQTPEECGHSNVSLGHVVTAKISNRKLKY